MTSLFSFLVVLSVLIFIHELGHYLLARLLGVGVERFSIGFGPRLAGWTSGRTDFRISAIPLGGYVKMVGDEPDAELPEEDIPLSFTHKPVWKRMLIVAAGPFFNLLLAVFFLWGLVFWYGLPVMDPVVGDVKAGSPAASAGLRVGDLVVRVDDRSVDSWEEIQKLIRRASEDQAMVFEVDRGDGIRQVRIFPELMPTPDALGAMVMRMGIGADPFIPPTIGFVSPGFPAAEAGLKSGDRVIKVNGADSPTWMVMARKIQESSGERLILDVEREGIRLSLEMQTREEVMEDGLGGKITRHVVGIAPEPYTRAEKLGFLGSMLEGTRQTGEIVTVTGIALARMVKGSLSRDNLGGPILIAQMAGSEARKGLANLLAFIAVISVNLALLNLLPIPVLDGGHLMFYTIELLRGKPVSVRGREVAQQVGIFLLLSLMVFAFYNDILRLFRG
ncbi:RIP metalloprotease RseP [Desulfobotulus sp. H1]|uniref:Zinc metalloprotease n=1 Tax=Desulfobotulus pelophilus TaxID=2823377 RepID=A0ABT3N5B5_9BACT|nr:RIP metalloprotease RseP [Desulfobotulus pelophilus]MCW7752647.1 RIP metalloprotease RseP [Desulfobotulus pelophilus]